MDKINEEKMKSSESLIVRHLHSKAAMNDFCASATFELTSRCNFRCRMCYVHSEDCNRHSDEELSLEQWTEIAKQAADAGVMFVLITGGEPFIRQDFCDIYMMLIRMGFVVSINTNLSLCTDEHIELFRKYPPNRINASLYGVSEETYQSLCGVSAYSKVIGVIEKIREYGLPLKISSSVTPYNCGDFDDIISFCSSRNIPYKTASYMFPAFRLSLERERLSPEDAAFYRAFGDFKRLDRKDFLEKSDKIEKGIEYIESGSCVDPEIKNSGVRCRAGTSSVWIDYKGNIAMCGMVPANPENNVLKKGFKECCASVRNATKKIVLPEKCTDCRFRYLCNVCAASCLAETGEFNKVPSYLCRLSERTAEYYKQFADKLRGGEMNED